MHAKSWRGAAGNAATGGSYRCKHCSWQRRRCLQLQLCRCSCLLWLLLQVPQRAAGRGAAGNAATGGSYRCKHRHSPALPRSATGDGRSARWHHPARLVSVAVRRMGVCGCRRRSCSPLLRTITSPFCGLQLPSQHRGGANARAATCPAEPCGCRRRSGAGSLAELRSCMLQLSS